MVTCCKFFHKSKYFLQFLHRLISAPSSSSSFSVSVFLSLPCSRKSEYGQTFCLTVWHFFKPCCYWRKWCLIEKYQAHVLIFSSQCFVGISWVLVWTVRFTLDLSWKFICSNTSLHLRLCIWLEECNENVFWMDYFEMSALSCAPPWQHRVFHEHSLFNGLRKDMDILLSFTLNEIMKEF